MLEELRRQVLEANLELVRQGLVIASFGNASGVARDQGLVVIKPSGVPYAELCPDDLVVTDLDGRVVEGRLRPSSDLRTHLALYRSFRSIGGVAHTHSSFATSWAQACREILDALQRPERPEEGQHQHHGEDPAEYHHEQ